MTTVRPILRGSHTLAQPPRPEPGTGLAGTALPSTNRDRQPAGRRGILASMSCEIPSGAGSLGEFLRSRGARLSPAEAGITSYGARRVPGLRREELAQLAGVSTTYYTRLEQGLSSHASAEVIDAIAAALRLDDDERAHLRDLARPVRPRAPPGLARCGPRGHGPADRRHDRRARPGHGPAQRGPRLEPARPRPAGRPSRFRRAGRRCRAAQPDPHAVPGPAHPRAVPEVGAGGRPGRRVAAHGRRPVSRRPRAQRPGRRADRAER